MSLHIGDKILEINGMPIRDTPLENVENLLKYSDTVLQVSMCEIIYYIINIQSLDWGLVNISNYKKCTWMEKGQQLFYL